MCICVCSCMVMVRLRVFLAKSLFNPAVKSFPDAAGIFIDTQALRICTNMSVCVCPVSMCVCMKQFVGIRRQEVSEWPPAMLILHCDFTVTHKTRKNVSSLKLCAVEKSIRATAINIKRNEREGSKEKVLLLLVQIKVFL